MKKSTHIINKIRVKFHTKINKKTKIREKIPLKTRQSKQSKRISKLRTCRGKEALKPLIKLKLIKNSININMGICCNNDIKRKAPVFSQRISVSTISKSVRLENIQKKFQFTRIIGYGVFGTVREATKKIQSQDPLLPVKYAIKSIIKSKVDRKLDPLRRELEILKTVDHPNIIKLYEVYEDKKYLHLVTEICTGGDLLDYLLKKVLLSEEIVVSIIFKALSAINYLHGLNICHRDIKPENFLLVNEEEDAEIKLVDFGMSNFVGHNGLNTFAGTPYYIAPEVIRGIYSKECDIWSLGVLMYFLLSGKQPFYANTANELFQRVLAGDYDFSFSIWDSISGDAKDLIRRMLQVDPDTRININEALKHEVFNRIPNGISINSRIFSSLKKFKAPSKLWNEAMLIFVKNFSIEQIEYLRSAFIEMDENKTGFITANDIVLAMKKNNYKIACREFSKIVENIDYIGKGKLNYSQFLVAAMDRKKEIDQEHLWVLFKYFDLDDDGLITIEELKYVLEKAVQNVSDSEIEEMIEEFKSRAPHSMKFDEFVDFIRSITEEASNDFDSIHGSRKISVVHFYTTYTRKNTKENVPSVRSVS